MQRFLRLEQARAIMKLWREKTVALYGNDLDLVGDGLIEALDELIFQPGTRGYCEGCGWWYPTLNWAQGYWRCCHADFYSEHCPVGRYEREKEDE